MLTVQNMSQQKSHSPDPTLDKTKLDLQGLCLLMKLCTFDLCKNAASSSDRIQRSVVVGLIRNFRKLHEQKCELYANCRK